MANLDYIDIPSYATRLESQRSPRSHSIRTARKINTSLPPKSRDGSLHVRSSSLPASGGLANSAASSALNVLPAILLSGALPAGGASAPRSAGAAKLLSSRDPLSIPITTVNFKRFVSKVGPVFWLQDRIEEVVMWRRGWRVTAAWMAAYAFLCYFPRLMLLVPNVILIGVVLATYPNEGKDNLPVPPANVTEGTVDWQANIQAIQNLMGAFSDLYDCISPVLPYLTHKNTYTAPLLVVLTILTLGAIPILSVIPLTPTLLVIGLAPFLLTHPAVRPLLPPLLEWAVASREGRRARMWLLRATDDARLTDAVWRAELRTVELWENERWRAGDAGGDDARAGGWGKGALRDGERSAWTRGRDGWSGLRADGSGDVSSNLTFSLAPGWAFVETEDWRADLEAAWAPRGSDPNGWVYSNDAWLDPRAAPLEEWAASGMTRRRRWTRRIYYNPQLVTAV